MGISNQVIKFWKVLVHIRMILTEKLLTQKKKNRGIYMMRFTIIYYPYMFSLISFTRQILYGAGRYKDDIKQHA